MSDKHNQDGRISEQWLAEQVTHKEAGVIEVNIAQTKEILKDTLEILYKIQQEEPDNFDELFSRHKSE